MKLSQIMLDMMSVLFIVTGFYCFEEKLLFSTSSGKIKELNIIKGEVKVLGNAESEVFVLAYDNEDKYVYVPRQTQEQIIRFPYPSNQTTEFEIVVSEIIPGGIAFDSEHRYLYWTEPMERKIMRSNTNGSNITRIFNDTVEPAALTIDKENRWMYFGQGIPNGTIHKLSLDDEGHHIINDLASWVFGIYADDTRLYWMDNFMGDLKSALFDGTDIQTIVSTNTFKLNGEVDVKDDFIFYTSSTQILKINKNGGEVPIALHTDTERVHGLLLFKQEGKRYK
ncbi:protein cueball-like [Mytilus trossulus]|uniref:protein cueball-like n=1 Tax=Mytilus trossulus TaxID=6551 RepID=UPI0030042062